MKKDIWENVYYRLTDPVEIRLAILFTLSYADIPMSDVELKHCMLEGTSVDFLELCNVLEQMQEENYIKMVPRDETEKFVMTTTGEDTIAMFDNKLLPSVKNNLMHAVDHFYKSEESRKFLRCDVVPLGDNRFGADLELKEGKTSLLALSLFAGNKARALSICRAFRKNPYDFYEKISLLLTDSSEEE